MVGSGVWKHRIISPLSDICRERAFMCSFQRYWDHFTPNGRGADSLFRTPGTRAVEFTTLSTSERTLVLVSSAISGCLWDRLDGCTPVLSIAVSHLLFHPSKHQIYDIFPSPSEILLEPCVPASIPFPMLRHST